MGHWRLLRAEMLRLRSRRLLRWLPFLLLAIVVGLLWQVNEQNQPLPAGATTPAQAQCLIAQRDARASDPAADFHCGAFGVPTETFAQTFPQQISTIAFVLFAYALLSGATSTGYEVSTGSLSTWLMFEPRRLRVMASKCLAAALWMLPPSILTLGSYAAASWAIHVHYGRGGQMTADDWLHLSAIAGRIVLLTATIAAVGAAVTLLVRYTGAAVAILSGWAVMELLFPQLDSVSWLLLPNIKGWMLGGFSYEAITCSTPTGACTMQMLLLPFGHSTLYLSTIACSLFILAAVVFKRRDIS